MCAPSAEHCPKEQLAALEDSWSACRSQLEDLRIEVREVADHAAALERSALDWKSELSDLRCAHAQLKDDCSASARRFAEQLAPLQQRNQGDVEVLGAEHSASIRHLPELQEMVQSALRRELEARLASSEAGGGSQLRALGEELRAQPRRELSERPPGPEAPPPPGRAEEAPGREEPAGAPAPAALRRFLADLRGELGAGLEEARAQAARRAEDLGAELRERLERQAAALRAELQGGAEAAKETLRQSLADVHAELSAGLAEAKALCIRAGQQQLTVDPCHSALTVPVDLERIRILLDERTLRMRDELHAHAAMLANGRVCDFREEFTSRLEAVASAQTDLHQCLEKSRNYAAEAAMAASTVHASEQAMADRLKESLTVIRKEISGGLAQVQVYAEDLNKTLKGALEASQEAHKEQLQQSLLEARESIMGPAALGVTVARLVSDARTDLSLRMEDEVKGLRSEMGELRQIQESRLAELPSRPAAAGVSEADLSGRLAALREELRAGVAAEVKRMGEPDQKRLQQELSSRLGCELASWDTSLGQRDRAISELRDQFTRVKRDTDELRTALGSPLRPLADDLQQLQAHLHRVEARAEQLCEKLINESLPSLALEVKAVRRDVDACASSQASGQRQHEELEARIAATAEQCSTLRRELQEQVGKPSEKLSGSTSLEQRAIQSFRPKEWYSMADSRLADFGDQMYALRMELSVRSESEAKARDAIALRVQRAALSEELCHLSALFDEKLATLRSEVQASLDKRQSGEPADSHMHCSALSAEVEALRSEQTSAASLARRLELGLVDVRRMTAEFAAGAARRLDCLEAAASNHRCAGKERRTEEPAVEHLAAAPHGIARMSEGETLLQKIDQVCESSDRQSQRTSRAEEWLQSLVSQHGDLERRLATLERRLQKELRGVEEPLEETLSQLATGVLKLTQLVGVAPEDACAKLGWKEACADLPRMLDHAWLRSRLPKRASLLRLVRQKADAEELRRLQAQVEGLAAGAAAARAAAGPGGGGAEDRHVPIVASARPHSARTRNASPMYSAEHEPGLLGSRPPTAPPTTARPVPHLGASAPQCLRSPVVAGRVCSASPRLRHVRAAAEAAEAAEAAPPCAAGPTPPPRAEAWAAPAEEAEAREGRPGAARSPPGRPFAGFFVVEAGEVEPSVARADGDR